MNDLTSNTSTGGLPSFSRSWTGATDDPEKVHDFEIDELLDGLSTRRLRRMQAAGDELLNIYRVIAKTGDNIVGLLLKDQGTFYEWDHYPKGDCYDPETHCQYYYHAHRGANGEHGHFHTFQRAKGMLSEVQSLPLEREEPWPKGDEALSHLVAVSMDKFGMPTHLFSTNRWVTGETLYSATDIIRMLNRFEMDLITPSWPVNRWLTAMITLFRPQIELLLHKRDAVLQREMASGRKDDVLEDRKLEITSMAKIDTDRQIAAIRKALEV